MKNQSENSKRLQEILSILKKHEIVKGLSPEKLRLILEDFGPTFVKLGQIMSMRSDVLPVAYCHELEKLRADVNPLTFEKIVGVLEDEYGMNTDEIFSSIEAEPLGSASIAQVHAAVLKDGTKIVVKVQRPDIREVMAVDFSLMRKAVKALKLIPVGEMIDFNMVLDELWTVSQQELDFLVEAKHAQEFYELNKDIEYVTCPVINTRLTTSKVLVMEYIDGFAVDNMEKIRENGYDPDEIGTKLAENYVKQVVDDGFFHADPHPGNIRIRDGKIVWIDMGMMGRLSNKDKSLIKSAVRAVAENDVNGLKSVILQMGFCNAPVNHIRLYADIDNLLEKYASCDLGSMNMGKILEEVSTVAAAHKITLPKGVLILVRGMITIEGVLSEISPDLNVVMITKNHVVADFLDDFDIKKGVESGARRIYASTSKSLDIPSLCADLLRTAIKGQAKLNMDITGSKEPLDKIDAMVTKLIVGILAASLLLGSSIICTTDMTPRTLGIPSLGFLGYITAFILTIWIIITSKRRRKK
ncbi:MAG: AarF/UbiB family protein [Oscillospiraceae bacterium]|nr:AarF/UbiB family protein [Oscillospiraceae bacterium]